MLRDVFRGSQQAPAAIDAPLMVGVEQEFDLFVRRRQVDFRTLFPRAVGHTHWIAFRNSDRTAILDAGYMLGCDGREAEFATAPIRFAGEGPIALAREVTRCRRHMMDLLRRIGITDARGYSTHLSLSVPVGRERELAEAFSRTVGPALVLLMESRQSPGLLLRPRRGRLEIGSEYLDDEEQLTAAVLLAAGAVRAALGGGAAGDQLPRIGLKRWEEAGFRPGIYLPRDAYGESIHDLARTAALQTEGGDSLSAGEVLRLCTNVVRRELEAEVSPGALEVLDRVVLQRGSLQIERDADPARIADRPVHQPAPESLTLTTLARTPGSHLTPRFVDWEGAAFDWKEGRERLLVGLPWGHLPALFEAARNHTVMSLMPGAGLPRPVLSSLEQLQTPQVFAQIDPAALGTQAAGNKGGGASKGGSSKQPGSSATSEPTGMPLPLERRPPRVTTAWAIGGLLLLLLLAGSGVVFLSRQGGGQSTSVPVEVQMPTEAPPAQGIPLLPHLPDTATPAGQCLPSPALSYPPAGAIRTGDALLRWSSNTSLAAGESFVVFAARNPDDLTSGNAQANIVGTTSDTSLALDFSKWKFAGLHGSFYWIVRIQNADGTYLDCGGEQPLTFVVVPAAQPTKPPKEGSGAGAPPPPVCPPNQKCP